MEIGWFTFEVILKIVLLLSIDCIIKSRNHTKDLFVSSFFDRFLFKPIHYIINR